MVLALGGAVPFESCQIQHARNAYQHITAAGDVLCSKVLRPVCFWPDHLSYVFPRRHDAGFGRCGGRADALEPRTGQEAGISS